MVSNVILVGAGRIGSRYLQGLVGLSGSTCISVYDPSPAALDTARRLWNEAGGERAIHELRLTQSLDDLPDSSDAAIVAVTADRRPEVVRRLAERVNVRYWVLEKILAQSVEEIDRLEKEIRSARGAWVNTPMHLWSLYRDLKQKCGPGPVKARYQDVRGLACNAVHYIDLVARWNGESVSGLDTAALESRWYPAERSGFYDVYGELKVSFSGGSELVVTSREHDRKFSVSMEAGGEIWAVEEQTGKATSTAGNTAEGRCEFQSQLTAPLLESIWKTGSCGLPSFRESADQHRAYLAGMIAHWNQGMPPFTGGLPIT